MSLYRGLLFDLDGVILDSMPGHVAAWQEVLGGLGLEVEPAFIYRHEGAIEHSTLAGLMAEKGIAHGPDDMERLLEAQSRVFRARYADTIGLYPRAEAVVTGLAQAGLRLALVTSSSRRVVESCLPERLLEVFETVVTSDRVTNFKPHPEPYLTALAELGLSPSQAAAVENAPAGIKSAKGAGVYVYGLTTTLGPADLTEADSLVSDLDHLARLTVPDRKPTMEAAV